MSLLVPNRTTEPSVIFVSYLTRVILRRGFEELDLCCCVVKVALCVCVVKLALCVCVRCTHDLVSARIDFTLKSFFCPRTTFKLRIRITNDELV